MDTPLQLPPGTSSGSGGNQYKQECVLATTEDVNCSFLYWAIWVLVFHSIFQHIVDGLNRTEMVFRAP